MRQRYQSSKSKQLTSSVKILHELGKTHPDAAAIHYKCFEAELKGAHEEREDYATLQTSSPAERKVLWIRVALVEGKLKSIVDELMRNPRYVHLLLH